MEVLRTSLNFVPWPQGCAFTALPLTRRNVSDLIPLSALRPGQTASVEQVLGVPDDVKRMEELGMRGGARVEMVQAGSPCIVLLAGQKLCFRSGALLSVLVRPGADL